MNGKLIRTDRNGTKYFEGMIECDRCNGKGVYIIGVCNGHPVLSPVDSGICFKCMGRGKVEGKWKEYTPEYEAKLEARRKAKSEAKQKEFQAEYARIEAERKAKEEAEQKEREAKEAEEKARKAKSNYIGSIGGKVDTQVILERAAWFEIPSFGGYGTDRMYIYTFRDDGGNAMVWKTTKGIMFEGGELVRLKGTIKEHSEYKDEKQTVLTRCKVEKVGA